MDQNCREQILSEDYADFIIESNSVFRELMTSPEICYTNIRYDYVIAHVPIRIIPKNLIQIFGYGIYPHCLGLLDIGSIEASGGTKLRRVPDFNLNGQGVLIGLIDTGIDYTHQAFKNEGGTSKIVSIWDQTIQSGSAPNGFSFGSEYKKDQINEALLSEAPLSVVPSFDEDGHGTFLAGIAAGTRSEENNFAGVVSDAEIVVVKLKPAKSYIRDYWVIPKDALCYQENDIMLGIEYLRSVATSLNRPMSICIGMGTSQGAHDGSDILSRYLSATSVQIGLAVVIGAGNEGNRGHHYLGEIKSSSEIDTVELKVGPNEFGFTLELWGQAPDTLSIDIRSPTGEYIPRIYGRLDNGKVYRFIFDQTIINVDFFLVEAQTGDQLILLRFQKPTEGIWRFQIYSRLNYTTRFHMWLPIHQFIGDETLFTNSDPKTTLTTPANTLRSIVVTAYDYTNQSLYLNNSNGFTREENISPDISAPGVNLVGPAFNNGYRFGTGTSVAAAHTSGVAAMLLEWGIVKENYFRLDTVQISNLFKLGAKRYPTITYPDTAWGYGSLDIYNIYISLRGGTPI